jgi:hypothetical protein
MSEVFKLSGVCEKGICNICDKLEFLIYAIHNTNYTICSGCYGNIPEYIPLEQDSQYIEAFLKGKL